MELTPDQYAKFRDYCKEIGPGEYGKVVVSFVGEPSNVVQITVEKNTRYQRQKADVPAHIRGTANNSRANMTGPGIRSK